jgi:LysM repeat protein
MDANSDKTGHIPSPGNLRLRQSQPQQYNPYLNMFGERGESQYAPTFIGAHAGFPVSNNAGITFGYNTLRSPYMDPRNGYNVGYEYTGPRGNQTSFNVGRSGQGQTTIGTRIGFKMGGGYFPEYHSYAPPRMEHGGASWLSQYEKGGGKKKKKASATDDYVDLQKTYGLDPFSKEGIEKARQLSKTNPRTRIVCTASGCSEIAVNAADAYGYDFERGNAWDLGNQNQVVATNPAYAGMVGQGVLPDPTNYKSPSTMFQTGSLIGLNRKNKRVGTVAKTRAEADDSYDYANQDIYPKSRGYEHVGYMIDPNTMLHGTAAVAGKHPAYYVIDNDMTNGAQLGEYGNYQPVETITPEPGIMSKIGSFFGFEDGGTNWLHKYADGGYTVKRGDNLTKISKQTGIPISKLAALNNIKDVNKIRENQVLKLSDSDNVDPLAYIRSVNAKNPNYINTQGNQNNAVISQGRPTAAVTGPQSFKGRNAKGQQLANWRSPQEKPAVKQVVVQTPQGPVMKEVVVDDRNWAEKFYQPEEGHIHKFQLPEDVYNSYQTNLPTNKGKKFGVVSKQNATGYFFDEDGNLALQDEVGIGEQMGDTPNVYYKNKTTPAGSYMLQRPNYSKETFDKLKKEYQADNFFNISNPDGSSLVGKPEGYSKDQDPGLAMHGIPTHLMAQRAPLFGDNNIDNNCMSAGCINARRQLLDNPYFNDMTSASLYVTPRTSPLPTKKKTKKMGGEPCYECGGMYAEGGEGGPGWGDVAWTAAQIADPTGILSYGDAYRGWRDMVQNPSWSNFGSALLNTAAALPVVGQEARAVKAGVKAGKVAKEWKELNALQKTGRVLNRTVVNPVRTLDRGIGHGAAVEATTAKLMTNAPKVVKNYVAPITTAVNRGVRWDKLMSPVGDAAIDGISNGLNYAQGRVQGQKYGGQTNWLNNYK